LKDHLYYLAYKDGELAASFDAKKGNKQLNVLLSVCKVEGYTVKEVTIFEYEREKRLAEEKDLKELSEK